MPGTSITVRQRGTIPFRVIARTAFRVYPRRTVLGLALVVLGGIAEEAGK
ncbi:MAG TPA: hypothetical protein VHH15_17105 [Actinophytocola sp.]|nr:hypothetical protein [Actinophytocola sp.]